MPDIPDQFIARRIEDAVQRDGELHDAKTSAEMPAGERHDVDGFAPKLVRELGQGLAREGAELSRIVDGVQQWGF